MADPLDGGTLSPGLLEPIGVLKEVELVMVGVLANCEKHAVVSQVVSLKLFDVTRPILLHRALPQRC